MELTPELQLNQKMVKEALETLQGLVSVRYLAKDPQATCF
jgi:hypothetical protein